MPLYLPNHVHIVYLDVRKIHWSFARSVAFHSFVWPESSRLCKSIVRTLRTNHCNWFDVLVVRGRCFSKRKERFWANRVLENLLLGWKEAKKPFMVYAEGHDEEHEVPTHIKRVMRKAGVKHELVRRFGDPSPVG